METAEVIVIGAGVAGLTAFERLRAACVDAVLLEARNRIGGRLHTLRPEGWPLPVELGPEFIHEMAPEFAALAGPDRDQRQTRAWRWDAGALRPAGEFAGGADVVFGRMREFAPPAPDCSFADFLAACGGLPPSARAGARAYIEGYEAADPARISVHSLLREQQAQAAGGGAWPSRPRDGFAQLLPADGRIVRSTSVQTIQWRRGEVNVNALTPCAGSRASQWRAPCAIITLPVSLLQRDAVAFDPPLAAKRAALDQLVMGSALRITLRLRHALWRGLTDSEGNALDDLGFLFGQEPESGHFPTWWALEDSARGAAQITGWAGGRHALALAGRSPAALRARALADLAARLRIETAAVESALIEAHTHDWQTDPWALGAYSYAAVGGADAFAALAAPLENTLFFAGEATDSTGHHATVLGALRSGRRAAAEVLDVIRGNSETP